MYYKYQIERLLSHCEIITETGCWIWTGCLANGYASASVDKTVVRVHKVMYEYYKEPVPDGLELHTTLVK
jgi:hypothetical protein